MSRGDFPILRVDVQPGDLALLFHDVHFGIEDPGAVAVLVETAQRFNPNVSIGAGDIHDTAALSTHRRDARQQVLVSGALAMEAERSKPALDAILASSTHGVMLEGNHEGRVTRFVDENPGLLGTLSWHTPFADALQGWDCLPSWSAVKLGPLLVHHGHDLEGASGVNAARRVLAAYPGQNTYFGHVHIFDAAVRNTSKNGRQEAHGAWTSGHLSDPALHANYAAATRHRWQQGFSLVEFWDSGDGLRFTVHQARVMRDSRNMPYARLMGLTLRG